MPIYEFECKKCKEKFELLVRSSSAAAACPACSSLELRRLMSSFAFASKDSAGNVVSSGGCAGCSGGNCSGCSH